MVLVGVALAVGTSRNLAEEVGHAAAAVACALNGIPAWAGAANSRPDTAVQVAH